MIVYLITNTINGKRYVGQTNQRLSARWWAHVNRTHCRILHSAILKHSKESFLMEEICEVPTKKLANEFEKEYIVRYCTLTPNGYNIQSGGDERPPMSEEQKEKLRQQMVGNKYRLGLTITEEVKKKLREANLGKILSQEHRDKISKAHLGLKATEQSRNKMAASKLGKTHSSKTKKKMKESQLARRAKEKNVRQSRSENRSPVPRTCERN